MTTHRSPDNVYASGGAVRQHDGKLPIYVCDDCGREVVWATSARTGRKYLANISHGANGFRFYVGASIHKCDRSRTPEVRLEREVDEDIYAAEEFAAYALLTEVMRLRDEGRMDEARALLDAAR